MSGFDLPNNYTDNLEALLRMNMSRTTSSSATTEMAKSLRDYSTSVVANVPIGPTINMGTRNFELHTGLIMMV